MINANHRFLAWSVAAACAGPATGVHAGGFQLTEQNASGLGNTYAGQGASAQDASTIFFNPAGMTKLPGKNAVGALNVIRPSAKFTNTAPPTRHCSPRSAATAATPATWASCRARIFRGS
jgi:long-chain fatty acid transport protein